jgi:hypothetical protein
MDEFTRFLVAILIIGVVISSFTGILLAIGTGNHWWFLLLLPSVIFFY